MLSHIGRKRQEGRLTFKTILSVRWWQHNRVACFVGFAIGDEAYTSMQPVRALVGFRCHTNERQEWCETNWRSSARCAGSLLWCLHCMHVVGTVAPSVRDLERLHYAYNMADKPTDKYATVREALRRDDPLWVVEHCDITCDGCEQEPITGHR